MEAPAVTSFLSRVPLAARLLIIGFLALSGAAMAMLYTVAREDAAQAREGLARAMDSHLTVLPSVMADWIVVGDYSVLHQAMDRYVKQEDIVGITFRDAGGVAVSSRDQEMQPSVPAWFFDWFDVGNMRGERIIEIGGRDYGVVEVVLSARVETERAWARAKQYFGILALAILFDFLGIWLVLRTALAPLRHLHDATLRLKSGDLTTRLLPGGDPELRAAMETFNEMADTLERDRELLSRDKHYLEVTLSSIGDAVITTNAQGVVEFVNATAEELIGWPANEARGRPMADIFQIAEATSGQSLECPVNQVIGHRGVVVVSDDVLLTRRGDNRQFHVDLIATPIRVAGENSTLGAVLVFRDETQKRAQEYRMNLLASVVEHASESVVITDTNTVIIDINHAFTNVTGYTRQEVIGKKVSILKSGRHDALFYEQLWGALTRDGYWHGEIFNRRKDGSVFVEMASISAVRNSKGVVTHYCGLFTDITLIKEQQDQLERLAYYDVLTGLPNRRLLADRFEVALAQSHRTGTTLAVCYLDLDGFKEVNDQLGHRAGDLLLVDVANRLKRSVRSGDTVARLGGDEFVLVLMGFDGGASNQQILGRILDAFGAPFSVGESLVRVSASIGVALSTDGLTSNLDTLLRRADHSMYVAKQAGRNRWHVFDATQDRVAQEHAERRDSVARALRQGEFRLHYQPKVNMRSGAIVGAEALIRWQHPDRGLLAPAEFLPAIQEPELSIAVGDWVIGEALKQMALWRQGGLTLPVSVNISAQHMQHPHFVGNLGAQLNKYPDLPKEMLEIEVLESSALEDISMASAVIRECRALGVAVALDDFGTGYASLTYLRRLPVTTIKIDQTFVRDMLVNYDDTSIVEGVIGLAKAFRREVIAEGVETTEHGVLLLRMGCELAQGYGIARPMAGELLPRWCEEWTPVPDWTSERSNVWSVEDLPLLYASVAHRGWVSALLGNLEATSGFLQFERQVDNEDTCAFGKWYETRGKLRYGHVPGFDEIGALHRRMHALGEKMVADSKVDIEAAQAHKVELLLLRDHLLAGLEALRAAVSA